MRLAGFGALTGACCCGLILAVLGAASGFYNPDGYPPGLLPGVPRVIVGALRALAYFGVFAAAAGALVGGVVGGAASVVGRRAARPDDQEWDAGPEDSGARGNRRAGAVGDVDMRLLLLTGTAAVASWLAATSSGAEPRRHTPGQTRELLVGKWEDPKRPGNGWEFDKEGCFTALIVAGVIRSHTGGTYRVLKDGSLELRVTVGGRPGEPFKSEVRVTRERLTFIDEAGKEESYQRTK